MLALGVYLAPGDISYVGSFDVVCLPTAVIAVVFKSSDFDVRCYIHIARISFQ